jgi:uncharacterized membrane protein
MLLLLWWWWLMMMIAAVVVIIVIVVVVVPHTITIHPENISEPLTVLELELFSPQV